MKTINYPLLYYRLNEDAVLGLLVGTEYQVVEKDLRAIKMGVSDYLQKQYKKTDYFPYAEILEPKLKIVDVKIRPTYRERTGSFPLAEVVKVPVPVVFGETEEGDFEAHLPLFDESFFYYDAKQFRSLVQYFATDLLNSLDPASLYRHLMYSSPKLEIVALRINYDRNFSRKRNKFRPKYETLSRLTVQYPFSKALRKNISAIPDAAWELEGKVAEVVDKLINAGSNLLIVGNHGVGKSSVLMQAIRKISSQSRKLNLNNTFWQIMPQRITASAKYLGEWQETCEELVDDLQMANGILWIVDIIRLLQVGGEGPEDSVASFLLSFLQQGKLQIVGEVTEPELESMRRLLPGFVENFQIIKIEELPEDKIQNILNKFADFSGKNLKVQIPQDSLMLAYRLLLRYFPYESFPGKAIKFLSKCVNEITLNEENIVTKEVVIQNFVNQTGLPELFLRDDILLDQKELKDHFSSRIIGQENAVEKLCEIVKVFKAGLNNPGKPITTLVFAGPTGVGKTASAKALADYFFGKGQKQSPLIRIDMSEFQYSGQISRFIGSGQETGKLIQDIRERPFSVLLLDEVEKAAPSIFDALLTVLDEGMLVDAFGRVTNFRNTIIILTTNLGASNRQSIGFQDVANKDAAYLSAINSFFRPEFVNRIDGVVMFNSLTKKDIFSITLKELSELKNREGFVKRGLDVHFNENVAKHLAKTGFDERYGARPLQRLLEQTIVNPLANWLLQHPTIKDRKVIVEYDKALIVKVEE
jgi:ATP-dependent Clp protease ATP-binding subunit ClpA